MIELLGMSLWCDRVADFVRARGNIPMREATKPKRTKMTPTPKMVLYLCSVLQEKGGQQHVLFTFYLYSTMGTTKQALGYMLRDVEMEIGKFAGKTVTVATARARGHVSFMRFCDMVAGHTTFNYMEVAAILNLAADTARSLVAGGESVDFGRLGSLSPTLRSKAVAKGEEFSAMTHIRGARVRLRPNRQFFRLDDVAFERIVLEKKAKGKKGKPVQPTEPKPGVHPEAGTPGVGGAGVGTPGASGEHTGSDAHGATDGHVGV